jgi:hypothetical protein
MPLPLLRHAEK